MWHYIEKWSDQLIDASAEIEDAPFAVKRCLFTRKQGEFGRCGILGT